MAQSTTVDCCASGSKSLKQSRSWKSRGLTPSSGKVPRLAGADADEAAGAGLPPSAEAWPLPANAATAHQTRSPSTTRMAAATPSRFGPCRRIRRTRGRARRARGRVSVRESGCLAPANAVPAKVPGARASPLRVPPHGFVGRARSAVITGRADVGGLEGGGGMDPASCLGFSSVTEKFTTSVRLCRGWRPGVVALFWAHITKLYRRCAARRMRRWPRPPLREAPHCPQGAGRRAVDAESM